MALPTACSWWGSLDSSQPFSCHLPAGLSSAPEEAKRGCLSPLQKSEQQDQCGWKSLAVRYFGLHPCTAKGMSSTLVEKLKILQATRHHQK